MGWLDLIPRAGNLYIGGLYALYQPGNPIKQAGITHVLSVIDFSFHETTSSSDHLKAQNHTHLVIPIEDDPNENLLQHFSRMNAFIDSGLARGGVFVHCAMGKSRSATAVVAFLMWKYGMERDEALAQVCEGRPVCEPNLGFMEQLEVFGRMLAQESGEERERVYEEWLKGRFKGFSYEWEARAEKAKL